MEPKGGKETEELVINVNNLAGVEQKTIDSSKEAIKVIWENYIGKDFVVELEFVDHIRKSNGDILDSAGDFNLDTGKLRVAVASDSFKSFTNQDFPELAAATLIVGHEMAHKLQLLRGEKLNPNDDFESEEYKNDPQEAEAWEIALHTFKKVHPFSSGYANYLGKKLEIPTKSKFI